MLTTEVSLIKNIILALILGIEIAKACGKIT